MGIHPLVESLDLSYSPCSSINYVFPPRPWCCVQSPTHANFLPSSCIPSCSSIFFGVCLWIIYVGVGGGQRSAAGVTPQVPPTLLLLLLFKRVSHLPGTP